MTYEVWNTATRNIVAAFATKVEAIALVHEAIDAHGAGYAGMLALMVDDGNEVRTLAIGVELAARAEASLAGASIGVSPP